MSHAFAARGARQTAVLAAIVGLHFAVYLAVTGVHAIVERVKPEPPYVPVLPPPPKPLPVQVPPSPGPMEGYKPEVYPRPDIPVPDIDERPQVGETVVVDESGVSAGAGPTVVYVPPTLRTRQARVNAAINSCYPAASRRMNEEGKVIALVTIGASGSAVNWSVAKSSGFSRLDAAIGCVLNKLEFVAGRRDGQAVAAEATLPITFQLD